MDLTEAQSRMAALDAAYHPIANAPIDLAELDRMEEFGARLAAEIEALGIHDESQAVLKALLNLYETGGEETRERIRRLFDRYAAFRWAAHLPREWEGAAEFRARLIHLSACDQGADTRDEILALQDYCERARRSGVDTAPILAEVAAMSSGMDRYGMGSMRDVLLRYGR